MGIRPSAETGEGEGSQFVNDQLSDVYVNVRTVAESIDAVNILSENLADLQLIAVNVSVITGAVDSTSAQAAAAAASAANADTSADAAQLSAAESETAAALAEAAAANAESSASAAATSAAESAAFAAQAASAVTDLEEDIANVATQAATATAAAADAEQAATDAIAATANKVTKTGDEGITGTKTFSAGQVVISSASSPVSAGSGVLLIQGNSNKERVDVRASGAGTMDPTIQLQRSGGTVTVPTATLLDQNLGQVGFGGYGTSWANSVLIRGIATENWTGTARGSKLVFKTVQVGSTAFVDRATIDDNGMTLHTGALTVPDEAYDSGWNTDLSVPTKNAIWGAGFALAANVTTLLNTKMDKTGGTFTGAVIGTTFQANSGSMTVRAQAAGNAHLYLLDEASLPQGLLYWSRSDDVVRLRRYNAAGNGVENELTLGALDTTSTVPIKVPNETYGAGWNGNVSVPTKNAIWDAGFLTTAAVDNKVDNTGDTLSGNYDFGSTMRLLSGSTTAIAQKGAGTVPTSMWRNDGANLYLLLSDASAAIDTSFNALRPFIVNVITGAVSMSTGQTLGGGTTITGNLSLTSGTASVFYGTSGANGSVVVNASSAFHRATSFSFQPVDGSVNWMTISSTTVAMAGDLSVTGDVTLGTYAKFQSDRTFIAAKSDGTMPTLMQRVSGSSFFFVLSDANAAISTTINALRPFTLDMLTGQISMEDVSVTGLLTTVGGDVTGTGHVTPLEYGAVGDGVTNDETALNATLDAASTANCWVDGLGKTYGVSQQWNTGTRTVRMRNCTIKQILTTANVTTDCREIYSSGASKFYLENVRIDRGNNGSNGGLFTAAGIYVNNCADVNLVNVEVYGNSKGCGIAIYSSDRCYLDRCYVHDITAGSSTHAAFTDDIVQGILIQDCDQAVLHAPRVENLKTQWSGQAAINRWSRGLAFAGTKDFTIVSPQIENVDQGCDITGDLGNYRFSVHGGSANNCYTYGFKCANSGAQGTFHGCRAYRCGYAGFIASGPSSAISETVTADIQYFGCQAIGTGYGNIWTATVHVTGFRIMNTAAYTAKPDGIQYHGCLAIAEAGGTMEYGFFSDAVAPVNANRMIYSRSTGHSISASSGLTVI